MDRKEAIEVVKENYPHVATSGSAFETALRELVPELAESEDEAHRKWILEYLYDGLRKADEQFKDHFKAAIAWLEKQKEQKPTPDWMPKFLDELRSKKHYFAYDEHRDIEGHILGIINWIAPNYFDKKEKEREPVPALDRGDEIVLKAICEEIKHAPGWVERIEGWYRLARDAQQPAEWSEEDERIRQCLIEDQEEALNEVANSKCGHSEIISDKKEMYRERIAWLKSLRPQPHWRPSKEQIKALDKAIPVCMGVVGRDEITPLESLYDDLKKL